MTTRYASREEAITEVIHPIIRDHDRSESAFDIPAIADVLFGDGIGGTVAMQRVDPELVVFMFERKRDYFGEVDLAIDRAKAIATDGCHKNYIAITDGDVAFLEEAGYGDGLDSRLLYTASDESRAAAKRLMRLWFAKSCGLRFVETIDAMDFTPVIGQGMIDVPEQD